jgi:hypothetical protein
MFQWSARWEYFACVERELELWEVVELWTE